MTSISHRRTMASLASERPLVREITDDEVAIYRENGWVKLDGLVDPEAIGLIRRALETAFGASGLEGNPRNAPPGQSRPEYIDSWFRNWLQPWLEDEDLAAFATSPTIGCAAWRLMGGAHAVQLWLDEGLLKKPTEHAGGPTPWHQDGPTFPFDRCGWLTFWIALIDVPPEMGSLRFYTGSHRGGFHGRVLYGPGTDTFTDRPELRDRYELSPPLTLQPGDATVHDGATIHGAPENTSPRARWSYSCAYFPNDTRYTGATQRLTDELDLPKNQRFEHQHFPVVYTPE